MRKAFLLAFVLTVAATAVAQTETATLSGRVLDPTRAAVVGAELVLTNIDTNVETRTKTGKEGLYVFTGVKPGRYRLAAGASGFSITVKKDLILHVQDELAENFVLAVGSVQESVTVSAEGNRVNTESGAVATVIDRNFVSNLPLNGRSFQSLILLTPGVTVTSATQNDYGQFSVNGQRASQNYFTLDGVGANIGVSTVGDANNTAMGGAFPGLSAFGGSNSLVSIDALEEYKIQTSTYNAEFGRQPGGQISLATRSGTNSFHGTLFEYLRNDVLDARDYFNRIPAVKPPLRQNQFGGTFGGPIIKNKTFFFFSYEGQILRLPVVATTYVPSTRLRNAAAAANSSALPLLKAFPNPTGAELLDNTGAPTGWSPLDYQVSNPSSMKATSIRVDHSISNKMTLFGRFNESPSDSTAITSSATYNTVSSAATRTLTLGSNYAFSPRLNNEIRLNYSRQFAQRENVPVSVNGSVPVSLSTLNNGLGGEGFVYVYYGGATASSLDLGANARNYQRQYNIVDGLSFVTGSHQLKFGLDYRRLMPTLGPQDLQALYFRSESAWITGVTTSISIYRNQGAHPVFNNYSLYGQDTWKVSPKLTLSMGLRWELNPAPTERDGRYPMVVNGIVGSDVSNASLAPPGSSFYKTYWTAFAPRVGAAYRLRGGGDHETVLRAGFGVFYDLGSSGATKGWPLRAIKSVPNVRYPLTAQDAARPTIAPFPTTLPTSLVTWTNGKDLQLPYTLQWNTAIEQSLGHQQTLSFSYVGAAARQLLTTQELNYPKDFGSGPPPNPNFNVIIDTFNGPTSDYHALQTQYQARPIHGLQALVNYTWSHSIDDVSMDVLRFILLRGNSDFDVRHNLSAAFTYAIPAPNQTPFLRHALGGWSLDGIVHAQTGRPIDVYGPSTLVEDVRVWVHPDVVPGQPFYISDPSVPGGRRFNAAAFTNPKPNPAQPTILQQGNLGRNKFRELPFSQVDFAMGRTVSLTESLKLQFKGEMFNILNHPTFGVYGNSYQTPSTFGVPTRTFRNSLTSLYGGLATLYQLGGPRSVQLSLRLSF